MTDYVNTYELEKSGNSDELQDDFLTMLMAQIQYQDPLDPMENSEFTAQLAQINTVEQLRDVNKNLSYEQLYLASINNAQSLDFIGKEVLANGSSVNFNGEDPVSVNYSLDGEASKVLINIYDANGTVISSYERYDQEEGDYSIPWDGLDLNGNTLAEGSYRFGVTATDLDGEEVDVNTMFSGIVDGISFEEGVSYVEVGGQQIAIGDIMEIKNPVSATIAQGSRIVSPNSAKTIGAAESDDLADKILDTFGDLGSMALKVAPLLF
ncbi:MAG: hypothetical protein GY850_05320 [bacterium]|nr:hypothetical protein [bacterium]